MCHEPVINLPFITSVEMHYGKSAVSNTGPRLRTKFLLTQLVRHKGFIPSDIACDSTKDENRLMFPIFFYLMICYN